VDLIWAPIVARMLRIGQILRDNAAAGHTTGRWCTTAPAAITDRAGRSHESGPLHTRTGLAAQGHPGCGAGGARVTEVGDHQAKWHCATQAPNGLNPGLPGQRAPAGPLTSPAGRA
jgi:hypothetical protein